MVRRGWATAVSRGGVLAACAVCAAVATVTAAACASAPRAGPRAPGPLTFVDATESAGLDYVQHALRSPPACLFNRAGSAAGDRAAGCEEERMTGGGAAGDYDGDGLPDLYVTRLDGPGLLYRNNGDATFSDVTARAGLDAAAAATNGALWVDADNDGDQDLYVTTVAFDRHYLFVNDGQGHFSEQARQRGAAVADDAPRAGFSAAAGDVDLDGWPDLHLTEWRTHARNGDAPPEHERLLRNRGRRAPGHFDDATSIVRRGLAGEPKFSFASALVDLDGDRRPDLAVAGDFGTSYLAWNDRGRLATRTAARVPAAYNAMGSAFGDYDNDGRLDWFTTGIHDEANLLSGGQRDGNRLARNLGGRRFADTTDRMAVRPGRWGWGAAFADFDNDGRLDLFMTTGQQLPAPEPGDAGGGYGSGGDRIAWLNLPTPPVLWRNEGARFRDVTLPAGVADTRMGKGVLVFDYDADGDLDIFVANNGDRPTLYRNDTPDAGGRLQVRVRGTSSNRDGLGAVVTLEAAGLPAQVRHIGVGSHFLGQDERVAHFGLGGAATATLRVDFPATQRTVTLRSVRAGRVVTVVEPGA